MAEAVRCKRCLLSEFDKDKYAETVAEYISALSEDKKADKEEYDRRLSVCLSCDMLIEGMCRECGCFVEIRAIKKTAVCPSVEHKW